MKRNIDEINKLADIAGLKKRTGIAQTLTFTHDLSVSQYRLLEIPKGLLDVITEEKRAVIRGDASEEAVLCTENASYELRAADTSNLYLLIPSIKTPMCSDFKDTDESLTDIEIVGSLSSYYELKTIKPKFGKLRQILSQAKYRGPEHESTARSGKYTFEDLMRTIQASEAEVREVLNKIGAFKLNGFWRILDVYYKEKAFAQILKLVEEEQWNMDEIPLEKTCEILQELYPREVLQNCLNIYGEISCYEEKNEVTYSLLEEKVCQFFAECILRGAERLNYHEFFEAWQQSVPDVFSTNKEQLKGIALEDVNSHPPVIWHFPAYELPDEPSARFNKLFSVRSKWTRNEIEPFIRELCGPHESMNALLLRFARCSTDSAGSKIYNSKRPLP